MEAKEVLDFCTINKFKEFIEEELSLKRDKT